MDVNGMKEYGLRSAWVALMDVIMTQEKKAGCFLIGIDEGGKIKEIGEEKWFGKPNAKMI